ncbi:MAG: ATP/GTP-binding protein [Betaproteobacteria bacterium]|nr:ATP/GTP-binding protein [Betaproteobacteria bacterium]
MEKENYKLVISGPLGVGKTTAVAALCRGNLLTTEEIYRERSRERARRQKKTTTIAFDYGAIHLEGGCLHVYGTPGQDRFGFMWDILTEGGLGLILLMDNTRPAPLDDLRYFVGIFRDFIAKSGLVVGVTRTDDRPRPRLSDYRAALEKEGISRCPVFEIDARLRENILMLAQALLYQIDPNLAKLNS